MTHPSSSRRARSLLLAAAILASPSFSLLAQQDRRPLPPPTERKPPSPPANSPPTTTPDSPAAPASTSPNAPSSALPAPDAPPTPKRAAPTLGTLVERTQNTKKDWTFTATVRVNSEASDSSETVSDPYGNSVQMPKKTPFAFETMTMIFPAIASTAACDAGADRSTGRLRLDARVVNEQPEALTGGSHSGVQLLRFAFNNTENISPREVILEVSVRATCFQTKFDEKAALNIPWPNAPWPDEAASTLAPQLFVDLGFDKESKKILPYPDKDQLLDAALKRYLAADNISDPKASTPVRVAKAITRGVWSEIQPSGDGLKLRRQTGELSGINLQPPTLTLSSKKGSEHDITCLMAALFRKAGLPTRTVIAWDVSGDDKDRFLRDNKKANKLRSWIEFYLFDDANNTYNWIPVDVVRARKSSSRPPAGSQPWKSFGTMDDFNEVVPFALHFHPPTDVVSYGTGSFWGWFVTPKPPDAALQALSFRAERTSVSGHKDDKKSDDKERPSQEAKPKTKRGN
jgi:hypothetical protein